MAARRTVRVNDCQIVRQRGGLTHTTVSALESEGEVGEDDERRAEAELQKLTDANVKDIDDLLKGKEEEILGG